jgi:hypothetical protein
MLVSALRVKMAAQARHYSRVVPGTGIMIASRVMIVPALRVKIAAQAWHYSRVVPGTGTGTMLASRAGLWLGHAFFVS